jgi:A/G-specific adenine glycosylase
MLQQTTVEAVRPYYLRFLRRFPDLPSLARARESDVLALWSGLGYYQRARNLRTAARMVIEECGGVFPPDLEAMLELPGIGPYTAGAIGSIAFGIKAAAIDTNASRVLSRLLGDPPVGRTRGSADVGSAGDAGRSIRDLADRLVPSREPGTWNQAVMELGARICRPSLPDCHACPVSRWCRAFAAGDPGRFSTSHRRPAAIDVRAGLLVLERADGRVLFVRRPEGEILAGLWELPGTLHEALRTTPGAQPTSPPQASWSTGEPAATIARGGRAGARAGGKQRRREGPPRPIHSDPEISTGRRGPVNRAIGPGTSGQSTGGIGGGKRGPGKSGEAADGHGLAALVRTLGFGQVRMEWRGTVRHAVTHRRLMIDAWHASPSSIRPARLRGEKGDHHLWADPRRLAELPVGSASRKVLAEVFRGPSAAGRAARARRSRGRLATVEPLSS